MYIKMKKVIQLKIKTLFLCMGLLLSNLCLADVYNVEHQSRQLQVSA